MLWAKTTTKEPQGELVMVEFMASCLVLLRSLFHLLIRSTRSSGHLEPKLNHRCKRLMKVKPLINAVMGPHDFFWLIVVVMEDIKIPTNKPPLPAFLNVVLQNRECIVVWYTLHACVCMYISTPCCV